MTACTEYWGGSQVAAANVAKTPSPAGARSTSEKRSPLPIRAHARAIGSLVSERRTRNGALFGYSISAESHSPQGRKRNASDATSPALPFPRKRPR